MQIQCLCQSADYIVALPYKRLPFCFFLFLFLSFLFSPLLLSFTPVHALFSIAETLCSVQTTQKALAASLVLSLTGKISVLPAGTTWSVSRSMRARKVGYVIWNYMETRVKVKLSDLSLTTSTHQDCIAVNQ